MTLIPSEVDFQDSLKYPRHFLKPELVLEKSIQEKLRAMLASGRPLEVEIGCGKAKFLIARAAQFPQRYFLAIERAGKWMQIGAGRAAKMNLDNILFLRANAREVLLRFIPEERVCDFHIYFPDPWPKRRHHKRRLINQDLIGLLHSRLSGGGWVQIATDDPEYFSLIKQSFHEAGLAWLSRESVNQRLTGADAVKTNYESKYEAAGRNLYYLEFQKS